MTLISKGYNPDAGIEDIEKEQRQLCQNIGLLFGHQQSILGRADYFFCNISGAYCSWPYISGDGSLYLGYLLLGLTTGQLIEHCSTCNDKVWVTSFGGSPLTGKNGWTGICLTCYQIINGKQSESFRQRMDFVLKLRQKFPATVEQIKEYDAFEFSFGGNGLKPVTKKRIVRVPVANPVSLEVLLDEIRTGNIHSPNLANASLLKQDIALKLSSGTNNPTICISLPGLSQAV